MLSSASLALVVCGAAFAQYSEQYRRCIEKANTQAAMNNCAKDEALRGSSELHNLYEAAISVARNQSLAVEKLSEG